MDVAGLRDCINSTLTAEAGIRKAAEAQLKQVRANAFAQFKDVDQVEILGFTNACLL